MFSRGFLIFPLLQGGGHIQYIPSLKLTAIHKRRKQTIQSCLPITNLFGPFLLILMFGSTQRTIVVQVLQPRNSVENSPISQ